MKFLFFFLLFTGSTALMGQVTDSKRLAKDLDSLIFNRLPGVAPGCVVLVAEKGQIVYEKAFGLANLEQHVAMQSDMVFRIGSITKQYTSIAILQLVEQGKIVLSDVIQKYIPDYPSKGDRITIENLLTHTSGIPDYEVLDVHIPNAIRIDLPAKQIIDSLGKLSLEFTPGSRYHYSNSNYFLLGYIIEQVTGKSYKDYLLENLFKPAGLSHTHYDSPTDMIPNRVNGYSKYQGSYTNAGYISMTQVFGAGALLSTVEDMFKWHQQLYAYTLVKKETFQRALTPFTLASGQISEYGYGWFIKSRNGYKSIEHSGGIDGFQSEEIYFPQQDIFVTALYNSLNEGGSDGSFMGLDNDIATLAIGKSPNTEISVDANLLQQFVGVYESDPKHPAIITLEGGQLQMEAKAGGLPKSPLFAKSENLFFLKIFDAEIEFVRDKGKVTQLIVHFNGQNQVARKVK